MNKSGDIQPSGSSTARIFPRYEVFMEFHARRFFIVAVAIIFMGIFLSVLIAAGWGTDPCSFMNINLSNAIGWTLGNWQLTLNIALLVFTIVCNRKLIGWGTLINMVLIGYTADLFTWIWRQAGLYDIISMFFWLRILLFIIAIVGFVLTASIYINGDMGLSPYDAAIKIISDKIPHIPYFILRICYDLLAIGIGFLAGLLAANGIQGSSIGSIVIAFTIGPCITWTSKWIGKLMSV